jgi:hypothetical protein
MSDLLHRKIACLIRLTGLVGKLMRLLAAEKESDEPAARAAAWRIRRNAWPSKKALLRRLCAKALEQDSDDFFLRSGCTEAEGWAEEWTPSKDRPLTPDEASDAWRDGNFCLGGLEGTLKHYQAMAKSGEGAGAGRGQAGLGQPEGGRERRRPGRRTDTDPRDDQRIADAWQSGQHKTYAELASALGRSEREVERAIDRHRHRVKKRRTAPE